MQTAEYTLSWGWDDEDPTGQRTITVRTAEDAEAALDRIAADEPGPVFVDVYRGTWRPGQATPDYGMQLVWGHPDRAALTWLGEGAGRGVDPQLPPWPEPIDHDQDQLPAEEAALTPSQVRQAVGEYVASDRRPTCVPAWAPV